MLWISVVCHWHDEKCVFTEVSLDIIICIAAFFVLHMKNEQDTQKNGFRYTRNMSNVDHEHECLIITIMNRFAHHVCQL